MVCGTCSDAGKSHVVTGLCRLLARQGVRVSPFKAQNMALNSYATADGSEIARAQAVQALAAGVDPEPSMNPVLLKPTGERDSQVVVMGRPQGHVDAASYQREKDVLFPVVLEALEDLRSRFDVVVCEGAGSPAEINLSEHDLVNLRLAEAAGIPAVVVGDIDRGGVFAALYGTVCLLAPERRRLVRGFIVNKLRGDPALLGSALRDLELRCGVPTIGVLPWLEGVTLDAEDSLALSSRRLERSGEPGAVPWSPQGCLDVAVLKLPRLANFTDLDPLELEPAVGVRYVSHPGALGHPDLVVLPGTKATVPDLAWLHRTGLAAAVRAIASGDGAGATLVGLCGGYQMLGRRIHDRVESRAGTVPGLGLLDVETTFLPDKLTRQRAGTAWARLVTGYEIHHGRVNPGARSRPWVSLDDRWGREVGGVAANGGSTLGTVLHGLFEADGFREGLLERVAARRRKRYVPSGICFAGAREAQIDRLADALEQHMDLAALEGIVAEGAERGVHARAGRGGGAALA